MNINKSKNKISRKRSKTKINKRNKKTKKTKRNNKPRKTKKTKRTIKKRKEKIIKNVMMGGSTDRKTASSAPTSQDTAYSRATKVDKHHIIFRHMEFEGQNSFNGVLEVIGSELKNQEVGPQLEPSEIAVIAPGNPENYFDGGSLFGEFRKKFGQHFAEDCRKMPLLSRGSMNFEDSTKGEKENMSGFQLALDEELVGKGWSTPDVGTVGFGYLYDNTRLFTGDARMVCNQNYEHCHNIINVSAPNARDDEHDNFLGDEGKERYLELASSCLRHSLILAHCKGIKLVVCTFIGCGLYNKTRGGDLICTVPEILFRLYKEAVKFCNLLTELNPDFMINICFMGNRSDVRGFERLKQGLSTKLTTTTYNETLGEKILGKITTLDSITRNYPRDPSSPNSELTKEQWEHIEYLYRGLNKDFIRERIREGYSLNRLMILYGLEYCCPAIKDDFKREYDKIYRGLMGELDGGVVKSEELLVVDSLEGKVLAVAKADPLPPYTKAQFTEKITCNHVEIFMETGYKGNPIILTSERPAKGAKGCMQQNREPWDIEYYKDGNNPLTKFEIVIDREIKEQYQILKTLQMKAKKWGCENYVVKAYLGYIQGRYPILIKHCDHLPLSPALADYNHRALNYSETYGHPFDCRHQMYLQYILDNKYLTVEEFKILTYELIYAVAFVHQCGVFIGEGLDPRTIMLTLVETGVPPKRKSSVMITDFSYAEFKINKNQRKMDWIMVLKILNKLKGSLNEEAPTAMYHQFKLITEQLLMGYRPGKGGAFVLGQTDGYTGSSELMTAMNEFLRGVPV